MGEIQPDWDAIREQYETTEATIAAICDEHGLSRSAFNHHRKKGGWQRDDVETIGTTVSVNEVTEAVLEEAVVSATDSIRDEQMARLQAELAEARSKLKEFEPEAVDWITDLESAERVLAPKLQDMLEAELEVFNLERIKRGRPPIDSEQMPESWVETQKQRIYSEAVANLTGSATFEGPGTRTQAWRKPDGTIVKIPYDVSIGNYAVSPTEYEQGLKRKGFTKLSPQPCIRENCWAQTPGRQIDLGGQLVGGEMFQGYCGHIHRKLDTEMDNPRVAATTTSSFSI